MAKSMDEYLSSRGIIGTRNCPLDMLKFLCLVPPKTPRSSQNDSKINAHVLWWHLHAECRSMKEGDLV